MRVHVIEECGLIPSPGPGPVPWRDLWLKHLPIPRKLRGHRALLVAADGHLPNRRDKQSESTMHMLMKHEITEEMLGGLVVYPMQNYGRRGWRG